MAEVLNPCAVLRVPLAEPNLGGNELRYLEECITTGWVSSIGRFVADFEQQLAATVGMPHALSTCNGTVALHLAFAALRLGPGDEVIVPDLTFAACANAVLYCGATPVLVDVRPDTWGLDPDAVRQAITPRTRAILAVHLYGHPCDLAPLLELAATHGLVVVEDVAESLGALYRGCPVGSLGHLACFSFYGNKIITTGEGGAILTRDPELFRRMAFLRDHGMRKDKRYWHEEVGFNYRLTNLQAAVGLAQLERLAEFVEIKRRHAALYRSWLSDLDLELPGEQPWAKSVFWMVNILLGPSCRCDRDELSRALAEQQIESRPVFYPLHQMPPYRAFVRPGQSFPCATELARRGLSLPSATTLSAEQIERVCTVLHQTIPA